MAQQGSTQMSASVGEIKRPVTGNGTIEQISHELGTFRQVKLAKK